MAIINLRDYYPFYTSDCFMEVSEEVAEMFKEFDRKEAAYRLRTYRHKAYYSLDRDDGLEHEAVFVALSPHSDGKAFSLPATAHGLQDRFNARTVTKRKYPGSAPVPVEPALPHLWHGPVRSLSFTKTVFSEI